MISKSVSLKLYQVIFLASVAYLPVFFVNGILWDDYTVSGLVSFETLKTMFTDNGVYKVGVAHFHHFLNTINGETVFISRLFSFLFLINLSVLFYVLIKKIIENETLVFLSTVTFICLPFFGSCFAQIVLPYIICFNLFFAGLILLIEYLKNNQVKNLALYFVLLLVSFITNSFIFFIVPCVIVIWFLLKKDFKKDRVNAILIVATTSLAILFFMMFKHFFMGVNPNSIYANYNKITFSRLLIDGPIKTISHIPKSFVLFLLFTWDVLKQIQNILFVLILFVLIYVFVKNIKWQTISFKFYGIGIVISLLLMFSGIFPYAVVGKVSPNFYDYSNRYDMLLAIGFSIFLSLNTLFFIKNEKFFKLVSSLILSVFIVSKACVFVNYYYNVKLQDKFYSTYLVNLDRSRSYLIYDKDFVNLNWRFYEIGGLLREKKSTQNILFIQGKSKFYDGKAVNTELIKKYTQTDFFSINSFDVNNFQIKTIDIDFKQKINLIDFIGIAILNKEIEFKVKEL
ncbi:MAG: hypothetical protein V4667_06615 [Bacteroidota bacterium]